jgi:hypothetical protein
MIVTIAIANVVVWSGVIVGLLLYLTRSSRQIDDQLTRLEAQISDRAGED